MKENLKDVPCKKCGKTRKFRLIKKTGTYKNYRELCAHCSGRSRIYPTLNDFTAIDTEQKAYFFGLFWADGCINRYKTFTLRLQICDVDILEECKKYFGGSISEIKAKREDGRKYTQKSWTINDISFVQSLKTIGFREHLKNLPSNLYNHFLRGLIDGDGSYVLINTNLKSITIASNYEDDFSYLKDILNSINYSVYHYDKKTKSSTLNILGKQKEKIEFLNWIYKDASVYLQRKYKKIKHLLTLIH